MTLTDIANIVLVSIHAPAGGATIAALHGFVMQYVSIHAPAGGATYETPKIVIDIQVSIHAPAGGATCL